MTSMGLGLLVESGVGSSLINHVVGFLFVLFGGGGGEWVYSKVLTCLEGPGHLELISSRTLNNFKTIFLFDSHQFILPF